MKMTPDPVSGSSRDERLGKILAEWLEAVESGDAPDPQGYLRRYPEFADELRQHFADWERFHPNETQEQSSPLAFIEPVEQFADFEVISVLGTGAFARVYLARQVSLGRQVALKVSANRGTEARTLASLEHDHIVRVFSETVDPEREQRLLCMQYVPGTTLERVIAALVQRGPCQWRGRVMLEIIDTLSIHPATLDPGALRDREMLSQCDWVETVCWVGSRLAEALSYAHRQGVLHRDIKPANVLVNPYGRPLLADFNLAVDPQRLHGSYGELFGGTLGYMAPEHLDAFNPEVASSPDVVDERSDLYSLGVVLFELLTGERPFAQPSPRQSAGSALRALAAERRAEAPSPRQRRPEVPPVLDRVLRRCLDAEPERRYQTAAELARALDGCRELGRIDQELPAAGWLTQTTLRHPFLTLLVLALLPHLLGSLVNISYNALRIVNDLTSAQQAAFAQLVLLYNLIVYPLSILVLACLLVPIYRGWGQLQGATLLTSTQVAEVRRRALALPHWTILLSVIGWLPGGILFPLGIHWLSGPVAPDVFVHFLTSFTMAGLIALTYSVFGVQFVVLRVLYPALWLDAQEIRTLAREELQPVERRLRICQLLAGLIPLVGAVLMISVGPQQFTEAAYPHFRLLVTALIALGMVGFGLTVLVNGLLMQTQTVLTRTTHARQA